MRKGRTAIIRRRADIGDELPAAVDEHQLRLPERAAGLIGNLPVGRRRDQGLHRRRDAHIVHDRDGLAREAECLRIERLRHQRAIAAEQQVTGKGVDGARVGRSERDALFGVKRDDLEHRTLDAEAAALAQRQEDDVILVR